MRESLLKGEGASLGVMIKPNKVVEEGWFLLRFVQTQTTDGDVVHSLRAGDTSHAGWWDTMEFAEGSILDAFKHGKAWPGAEWSNPNA